MNDAGEENMSKEPTVATINFRRETMRPNTALKFVTSSYKSMKADKKLNQK